MIVLYAIVLPKICNRIEIPHKFGSISLNASLEIKIQANEAKIARDILDDFISNLIDLGYNVEAKARRINGSNYDDYTNVILSFPEDKIRKVTISEKNLQILSNRMKSGDDFS